MSNKTDINRRSFLKSTATIGAGMSWGLIPNLLHAKGVGLRSGDLETALKILNLFSTKPEATTTLYSAIYTALKSSQGATFETVSKDPTVQKLCKDSGVTHLGGPMLGDLKNDGAKVWLRTLTPAQVTVKVSVNGETRTFGPVTSTFESDLTAVVEVKGLPVGLSCAYQVYVDGNAISLPTGSAITTPPADEKKSTRIVFGTCQHRWGLGNEKMSEQIIKRNPHAFLNYGDIAVQDRRADFGMQRADYALRDFHPAWRNIVSSIPVYASWDDHDYARNDGWGIPGLESDQGRKATRKIFSQSWNNPYYGLGDEGGGIFQHTRIGPCDVIMTDNRYFRKKEGKHCFFGNEQMAWLKKTLLACKGQFIILSCGTMWFDYVSGGKDGIGKFDPEANEEIFNFIEENKIPGVLLISGDRHGARGFKTKRPSGFEFYEFEPASLGGRGGQPAIIKTCDSQLFGINNTYAFGEFAFDVSRNDPEVTFRLIRDDAKIIYELTLKRSQLTPK